MSTFRSLCEARACFLEREARRLGSVAARWDSAAASLRFLWAEVWARAWRALKRAMRSVVWVAGVLSGGVVATDIMIEVRVMSVSMYAESEVFLKM